MEERFFFMYHMHISDRECLSTPVHERKWFIQRFVEQKQKESDAIDNARKQK